MTQVKVFEGNVEKYVNKFLEENDGKINVKDIKYAACANNSYIRWSAMIIYETI